MSAIAERPCCDEGLIGQANGKPGAGQDITLSYAIVLPVVLRIWPPVPEVPHLHWIDNADLDNLYTVSWIGSDRALTYSLEQATDALFTDPTVVYQGPGTSWSTPEGGMSPSSYYYRVRATNTWGSSLWSSKRSVRIWPIFVGLFLKWDITGYYRNDDYMETYTWFMSVNCDRRIDADTVRSTVRFWRVPDPNGEYSWEWHDYVNPITGVLEARSDSAYENPNSRWTFNQHLGYNSQIVDGQTVTINGQDFAVIGPKAGRTEFGAEVQIWDLTNGNRFVDWQNESGLELVFEPGGVRLQYDAGGTRLLLQANTLAGYHFDGKPLGPTLEWVYSLSSANAFADVSRGFGGDLVRPSVAQSYPTGDALTLSSPFAEVRPGPPLAHGHGYGEPLPLLSSQNPSMAPTEILDARDVRDRRLSGSRSMR